MNTDITRQCNPGNVVVRVPGSKSLTQRALVIAALAQGRTLVRNGLVAEDTRYLMNALRDLGAEISFSGNDMAVTGTGGKIRNPGREIFLGNNGTALRFLLTFVSLGKGRFILDGDGRLRERPVGPLLDALETLGVRWESAGEKGYPPVIVEGRGLSGGQATLKDVESSQYISSLLLSAPYANQDVLIQWEGQTVSEPYVDMTIEVMGHFGVDVVREGESRFKVEHGRRYTAREYLIESDASSASYFFLAAALCRRRIRIDNMNPDSRQGDMEFLNILEMSGSSVIRGDSWIEVVGGPMIRGEWVLDMGKMPDMVPTLAVLSAFRPGRTVVTHVSHLRFKESDRIASLVNELRKVGVIAEETEDGLIIEGGKPHGADIETYNDHRIAMSFAVAGLVVPGMNVRDRKCVDKSFPGFWDELKKL